VSKVPIERQRSCNILRACSATIRSVRLAVALLAAFAALVAPAAAVTPESPWPPRTGPGHLFVHYGEEHWNDKDGEAILTKVVEDSARYRPDMVAMSGDKANNGVPSELGKWLEIMGAYDRASVPWFAGVGNHDRAQATGENALTDEVGGSTPIGDIANYREVFKSRPYPMGDAPPLTGPFGPAERPKDDPDGAASHYYVDYGNVRWIYIDNSCYGIQNCDPLQSPPDGAGLKQLDYLATHGGDATKAGKVVFVVTHMPTQDPGDQSYRKDTAKSHTMGKGTSPDNAELEKVAEAAGVDGVFLGHIKGQFLYKGRGGVQYYIDGGAGGELYSTGPVGTDHGYWHGFRLVRVDGDRIETDAVPIFTPDSIRIEGPERVQPGEDARFEAFGRQPVKNHSAKVEALELRDPDPTPKAGGAGGLLPLALWLGPLALLGGVLVVRVRPRLVRVPALAGAALLAAAGLGAVALAQQSEPTATPREDLPNPARIFTSGDGRVLAPVASDSDDPRRDPATQTADGRFEGACPGRTTLTVTSGWEETSRDVVVASTPGPIASSVRRRTRAVRRGKANRRVATVRLAQAAILRIRLVRPGGRSATLVNECLPAGARTVTWDGRRLRIPGGRTLRIGKRGPYALEVTALSDRAPVVRRLRFRVR